MHGSELFEAVQALKSKLKCTTLMKSYSESRGHRKHYETIKYSSLKSTKIQTTSLLITSVTDVL